MRLPQENDPGTMYLDTVDPGSLAPGTVDPEYVNICRDNSQICYLIFALANLGVL